MILKKKINISKISLKIWKNFIQGSVYEIEMNNISYVTCSFYWNKEGIIDFDFNFANAGYCNVVSSDAFTYFDSPSNLWYTNLV